MNILVVGSGAREHALVWKLAQEPGVSVCSAPGNPGMAAHGLCFPDARDLPAWVALAQTQRADLVVVGPEAPLAAGLVDALAAKGIAAFGPNKQAARLEASKVFAKEFMVRHCIPTADFRVMVNADAANNFVRVMRRGWVVKADGLAAGKGVVVADTAAETIAALDTMMRLRHFGTAGARVVLEERLEGQELSFHVLVDGEQYLPLAVAQDHKRLGAGDQGPNTGGMGACSPPPVVDAALQQRLLSDIVEPTLRGMVAEGTPLRGVLFVGVMLTATGPKVLEYNVRFGDPECQTLMMRLGSPLAPLLLSAAGKGASLGDCQLEWRAPAAVAVVLAAAGYPEAPRQGDLITGLDAAGGADVQVFHAGTGQRPDGSLETTGGRVLTVAATAADIERAAARAYAHLDAIDFAGKQYRSDIAWRARGPRVGSDRGLPPLLDPKKHQ